MFKFEMFFDMSTQWIQCDCIFKDVEERYPDMSIEEQLEKINFRSVCEYLIGKTDKDNFECRVYSRFNLEKSSHEFLLQFDSIFVTEFVYAPNLPSFLEFKKKYIR